MLELAVVPGKEMEAEASIRFDDSTDSLVVVGVWFVACIGSWGSRRQPTRSGWGMLACDHVKYGRR